MSIGKILRLDYDSTSNEWTAGGGVSIGYRPVRLVRGDTYHLQIRFRNAPALTGFDAGGLFGMKSKANFDAGADFDFVFAGFDVADPFHAVASKQFSIPFVVPSTATLAKFLATAVLYDEAGNKLEGTEPFTAEIVQAMALGTETNMPPNTAPNQYKASVEITGSNTSVTVEIAGLTAETGLVVFSPETASGGKVAASVTIEDGQFTIDTGGVAPEIAPGDGLKFKFIYWVVRL